MPGDDAHASDLGLDCLTDGATDQGFAVELGEQFVATASPIGLPDGCEHHEAPPTPDRPRGRSQPRQGAAWNFHKETAYTPAGHFSAIRRMTGKDSVQHPVKAVFLRRAGTAGRPDDLDITDMTEDEQITGIDGQTDLIDHTTGSRMAAG